MKVYQKCDTYGRKKGSMLIYGYACQVYQDMSGQDLSADKDTVKRDTPLQSIIKTEYLSSIQRRIRYGY